jgi:hypothetical protein
VIVAIIAVPLSLVIDYNIWVWLLDLLPILCNMHLLSMISATILKILTVVRATAKIVTTLWPALVKAPLWFAPLVIFSRLYIDFLVEDIMTFLLICHDDLLF